MSCVLTSTDHAAQLVNTFGDLFKNNVLTDVTLICDDKIRIEAHRIVLCAGSTMFRDLLVDTAKQHPLLYLKGIKTEHLDPLLQYLYYGEATIPQNKINEFLSVSKDLEVIGLDDDKDGGDTSTQNQDSADIGSVKTEEEGNLEDSKTIPRVDHMAGTPVLEWNGIQLHHTRRNMKTRSWIWKYSGYLKSPDGSLDKSSIMCALCGRKMAIQNHRTSNMASHLKSMHSQDIDTEDHGDEGNIWGDVGPIKPKDELDSISA